MPLEEVAFLGGRHTVGVVEGDVWEWTFVVLTVASVEEMREVTFAEFLQTKGFGEGGERKR